MCDLLLVGGGGRGGVALPYFVLHLEVCSGFDLSCFAHQSVSFHVGMIDM